MKKRILLVLTLLVAFFGFMGLSISNKQVDVYAAGDLTSVDSDLQVVLNNIPERAILSFPVTYESVYGNEISFAVEENQSAITYDAEAHWMVVDRANADTVTITVTVKGEGEAVLTGTKEVTVPEGVTATRSFAISYNYGYENPTELENPKTSYNLGEASFVLAQPTRFGYKFAGWYENEEFTGAPISKVLVGSMKDYTLYAKWTTMGFDESHVSFVETPDFTYDGSAKTPEIQVKNPYGDGYLEKGADYTVSYDANTNAGVAKVTITGNGEYAGSEENLTFNIAPKALVITIDDQTKVYGESDPEFTYTAVGLIKADQSANLKIQRVEGTNVGEYAITSLYENTNYDITVNKGELTITKATLTFTPKEAKKYNLGITPSWSYNDFNVSGLQYEESTSVLEGEITATYYQNDIETPLSTAGDYVAKFSGVSSNNYNITFVDGQVTVVVADVNFIPNVYTYNGTSQILTVTVQDKDGNPINDGTLTYDDNEHTNAGTHNVKVRFEHSEHGIVETNVDIEIAKADLTITATSQDKTYGDPDPKKSGYFEAELQGDDAISEEWISRATGEAVGSYEVTLDTKELAENYNIDGETTTKLNINKKGLLVVAHPQTITYGEGRPEKSVYFTSEDLVLGDTISEYWVTVEEGTNVGTYEVTLDTTELAKNYTVSGDLATTLTITPKDLKITIKPIDKTYGEKDPTYLFDTTGLVEGDSLDLSGFSREEGDDVKDGGYAISYDESKMPNYNVSFNDDAVLTINPFDLTGKVKVTLSTYDNTLANPSSLEPGIKVMYEKTEITSFTRNELNISNKGEYTIELTFNGNYTGTASIVMEVTDNYKALEDAEAVETEMSEVTSVTNGQQLLANEYKSTINWVSSNTGVQVVNGKVQINEAMLNGTTVTLTANVSFENGSDVRTFELDIITDMKSVTDEDTQVRIENFPSDNEVSVEDVTETQGGNFIIEEKELLKAYDIKFDNGDVNSFESYVTVKLPIPAEEKANADQLKVYHITSLDPLTKEEVNNLRVEGDYLVFEANSFSPYIIVKECEHSYNDEIVAPTCKEEGYTKHTCEKCGYVLKDTYTSIVDHKESEWKTITEASCTQEGKKQITCIYCDEILATEQISVLEHNYVDNTCSMCGKIIIVPYKENFNTYINMGKYPQSLVTDESIISELSSISTTNELGYIEHNGDEYKKLVSKPSGSNNSFINGSKIENGSTYYFKVEPIKWRVLHKDDNTYTIIAEMLLDNTQYYSSIEDRNIDDETIKSTNYMYSNVRAWLNGYNGTNYNVDDYTKRGFYDIAFSEQEKAYINSTLVDNSAETTSNSTNAYICDDTEDMIYLLSYKDVLNTQYLFENADIASLTRGATVTDYGRANGCYIDVITATMGKGEWWLRSSNYLMGNTIAVVMPNGDLSNILINANCSVRPVMNVQLEVEYEECVNHDAVDGETLNEATCEENGQKQMVCSICEEHLWVATITKLGHNLTKHNAKEATCTEKGHEAYEECTRCDYTTYEEIEATGHTYVDGTCENCGEEEITESFTWQLVTDASELNVGDQIVIVAKDSDYALSTTQNSNNRGQAAVTKDGNTITFGNDVQIITLENGTINGSFAFNTGNGYLYAASTSSNHLKTQSTIKDNGSWTIDIESNGNATIKANLKDGRNWLRYNKSNNPPIFSCYGSGQSDICIYKLTSYSENPDEPTKYSVSVSNNPSNGGSATLSTNKVASGEEVTLIVIPNSNYKVSSILVNSTEKYVEGKLSYNITIEEETIIYILYEELSSGNEEDDDQEKQITEIISIDKYASANGWKDATQYKNISINDVVSVTVTGGSNTGKYYTNGNNWRIYQNESPEITISATEGYTLVSVKITYTVNNNGVLILNGTPVSNDTVVSVNGSSIVFGVGNTGSATNGQVRITAIEVVYQINSK